MAIQPFDARECRDELKKVRMGEKTQAACILNFANRR